MKKIVLLRHGESAWNKENRFTGWTDVDLTEKGKSLMKRYRQMEKETRDCLQKSFEKYFPPLFPPCLRSNNS